MADLPNEELIAHHLLAIKAAFPVGTCLTLIVEPTNHFNFTMGNGSPRKALVALSNMPPSRCYSLEEGD